MEYDHLPLPINQYNYDKKKKSGFMKPNEIFIKDKIENHQKINNSITEIEKTIKQIKDENKYINPSLIFKIELNQVFDIEDELRAMNIDILSISENKKDICVVFSNKENFKIFKDKFEQFSGLKEGHKYNFFYTIQNITDIKPEDKIGKLLKETPLDNNKAEYLNIELWRTETISDFIIDFQKEYQTIGEFRITDKLIKNDFALLRVKITKTVFEKIIKLKEIAFIERLSNIPFNYSSYKSTDVNDLDIKTPDINATGILVIDSGIMAQHELLKKSFKVDGNFQDVEDFLEDNVGHGTAVSGFAIYGDIKKSIDNKEFIPSNWLFSAKVMYAEEDLYGNKYACYDPEKLLEHQFEDAIRLFAENEEYKIKVINISIGNGNEIWKGNIRRQFHLAALIDDLAFEFKNIAFVVSTGNCNPENEELDKYPNYFFENDNHNIINPATSALSITVGSIAANVNNLFERDFIDNKNIYNYIAHENEPSPFTRVGFGINKMLKPEVVEYGGNFVKDKFNREYSAGKIITLSNNIPTDLISLDLGTSFSAPKISHILGKIANNFPHKSANYIKNLLLLSAKIPEFGSKRFKDRKNDIMMLVGYGLPDYEKAIHSTNSRVVLINEDKIGLNKIKIYSIEIPEIFFKTKGTKSITVVLTFNPKTKLTRSDSYLGNKLSCKIFHSIEEEDLKEAYSNFKSEDSDDNQEDSTPDELKRFELKSDEKITHIKSSCHQKITKTFQKSVSEERTKILLLVKNENKWIKDETYEQEYCISVMFNHSSEIDLYNEIKLRNQIKSKIKV